MSEKLENKDLQQVFKEFNNKLDTVTSQVGELNTFKEGIESFKKDSEAFQKDATSFLIVAAAPEGTGEDYQTCMSEQMTAGKSMSEAAEVCKVKFPPKEKEEPTKTGGAGEVFKLLEKAGVKLGEEDRSKLETLIGKEALDLEHLKGIFGELGEQYPAAALAKGFSYLDGLKGSILTKENIQEFAGLLGAKKTGETISFPEKIVLVDDAGVPKQFSVLPQDSLKTGEALTKEVDDFAEEFMGYGLEHQKKPELPT